MPVVTERLAIQVEANAGKAIAEFKQLGNATQTLGADVGKTGGLMSRLSGQMGGLFSGGAGVAGTLAAAGTALAGFAATGLTKYVDLVKAVEDFRRVAGGTMEDASRLVAAFDDVGVAPETAAKGVFNLEKRLVSSKAALQGWGVVAAKNADGTTNMAETLLRVGDAYKNIRDPAQRAAFLTAAFGRSGTELIPILERSRSEIQGMFKDAEETGQIVTDEDRLKVRAYNETLDDLQDSVAGLQMAVGEALVPAMIQFADNITSVIGFMRDLGSAFDDMGDSWQAWVRDELPAATSGIGALVRSVGTGLTSGSVGGFFDTVIHGTEEMDAAMSDATSTGTGFAAQLDIVRNAINGVSDAADDFSDLDKALMSATRSERGLADAQGNLTDAQADYNKLLKEGAVNEEKVADATRSHDAAVRSLNSSKRAQRRAQDDYNDALAAYNALPTDTNADALADARDKLADADDDVASALERQQDAKRDLDQAKTGDPDYQDKLAKAKQRVADATFDLADKSLANVTAQREETTALAANADQVERLLGYYREIVALHPETALALNPLIGTLGGSLPPAPVSTGLPAAPSIPGGGAGGVDNRQITITNNIDGTVDPSQIARQMIWQID